MSKLISCKDCGHQVSKNAKSCPNCGAKIKKTSILLWIVLAFIGIPFFAGVFGIGADNNPDAATSNNTSTPLADIEEPQEVVEPAIAGWNYDSFVDDMRGSTTYTAIAVSKNSVNLESPYSGGTNLSIVIRHSDELNNEVLVVTNNGQLWCEYRDCIMTVKFDDKGVEEYPMSRAAAGSSEAMFLDGSEEAFINQLKDSKTTMLEIGFFNNGNQQFTFDTADLDWQY